MEETISIILPTYNAGEYIVRTLKSVCGQTYSKLEIIVVDDGSTDNTLAICKEYAKIDNRIKVYTKANEGVTKARDFGIGRATGEFIGFVDSDDTIEPEMYEVLYNNIKKYDADISHCGYKTVDSDGNINYYHNTQILRLQNNAEGIIDLIKGEEVEPSLCNKLYKHSLFSNLEYDKNIKINEDYLLNLFLFGRAKKSIFEDKPLYNYHLNDNSGSTKSTKEYFYKDILKAADITERVFKGNAEIYPYAQRKWFKTYSSMYKNQSAYIFDKMEFDLQKLLSEVLQKLKEQYPRIKGNKCLNPADKFILFTVRYCPKLLVFISKIRG